MESASGKFKHMQWEELQASGIDCELSKNDALIEGLCEKEDSFSAKDKKKSNDKEAAEEITSWNAWSRKKYQMNPLEAAPKRTEEAGVMQLNSWKKKPKVCISFANRS